MAIKSKENMMDMYERCNVNGFDYVQNVIPNGGDICFECVDIVDYRDDKLKQGRKIYVCMNDMILFHVSTGFRRIYP